MHNALTDQGRYFLKDTIRQQIDFAQTDQNRGVPPPPIEKLFPADATRIDLIPKAQWTTIKPVNVLTAIEHRRSHRAFKPIPLTLEELSFLLWATQGIRQYIRPGTAFRTVPSAGCRHALETHLSVQQVEGLEPAFYRYLPLEHQLVLEFRDEHAAEHLVQASFAQTFTGKAAVTFIWTAIPYRMEWRYSLASYKVLALDAGHVCQNLYLACEAIGAGTCAVAAYHQELMDQLLALDGREEFTIYLAPVGKIAEREVI